MKNSRVPRGMLALVALAAATSVCWFAAAQEASTGLATVDLHVDSRATISVDGGDFETKRRITFPELDAAETRVCELRCRFPDGTLVDRKILLRGGWNVRAHIESPQTPRPELVLQHGHGKYLTDVAFTSDGKRVVTSSGDSTAVLWDVATKRILRVFRGHTDSVWSIAIGPRDKWLLTAGEDHHIILWELSTGERVRTYHAHENGVHHVSFHPDGLRFVSTSRKESVANLWRVQSERPLRSIPVQRGALDAAFTMDGENVLIGTSGEAVLHNVETGAPVQRLPVGFALVKSVAIDAADHFAVLGLYGETHDVIVWDLKQNRQVRTLRGHTELVDNVDISPNGRWGLSGSTDETAILWDLSNGKLVRRFHSLSGEESSYVRAVKFGPRGERLLVGFGDKSAVMWQRGVEEPVQVFAGHKTHVTDFSITADGQQFAIAQGDQTGTLWNAETGVRQTSFEGHVKGYAQHLNTIAVSDDGRQALTGSNDNTAILWDAETGELRQHFRGHRGDVKGVALDPQGRFVLTGARDNKAILWDASTADVVRMFEAHKGDVECVAFVDDGKQILTGSADNTAILWDVATATPIRVFEGHESDVESVAISLVHRILLTGSSDDTAILWDLDTGEQLKQFSGHGSDVWSADLTPDGRWALTGSTDTKVILWDVATGRQLRSFPAHVDHTSAVALCPDGRRCLTGGWDGATRMWDLASGELLATMLTFDGGHDWLVVTPDGSFDGSQGGRERVTYRVGTGLNVIPVDRLFQDYYRPGLLSLVWSGQHTPGNPKLGAGQPPTLAIEGPSVRISETANAQLRVVATDHGGGVANWRLYQNGAHVLSPGQAAGDTDLSRTFTVRLVEGENDFRIVATNRDGSWESEPAELALRYERPLRKSELYVLAVGISEYAEDDMALKFAEADSTSITKLFQRRGESLYNDVHVRQLNGRSASAQGIRSALSDLAGQAQPQDTLVVFFAGHGVTVGQRYYFLPQDFKLQSASVTKDVRSQGVPIDQLGEWLALCPALKRVLIFDTCQSGSAVKLAGLARNPFAFRGAIERLTRAQGVFTIAATGANEEAKEVEELGHGILTYTLLAGLSAVDVGPLKDQSINTSNPDRVVEIGEWFSFAAVHVPQLTQKYFGKILDPATGGQGRSFPILSLDQP